MDDGWGWLIGAIIVIAIVAFVVYVITLVATAAAAGGFLWGGGWAVLNYGKSIKENLIDSNRAAVDA